MFEALVARTQSLIATAEVFVPLSEQAFACAALSRLGNRRPSTLGTLTYLSGPEGIGKSFLARHTIREIRRQHPKLVSIVATTNELEELLTAADQQQGLAEVLEAFVRFQVLVCEDLHALEASTSSHDLLLELIDVLIHNGTHVLITSRKLPGEVRGLSPRWISRCHGGLCTTLPMMSRKSRVAFLSRLAEVKQLPLAKPVGPTMDWLADRWPVSPRELSIIVSQLVDNCQRRPSLVDIPFLERWFSEHQRADVLSMDTIAAAVASEFGVQPADLRSRSRQTGLIVPRQCAMFLARELTGRPLESIGDYFGKRTHTTVSHCLSRLKELLPQAPTLRQQVQRLRKRIAESRREDCA
jgi:chromosomal replication initiator protein